MKITRRDFLKIYGLCCGPSEREVVDYWLGEPSNSNSAGHPDSLSSVEVTSLQGGNAADAG